MKRQSTWTEDPRAQLLKQCPVFKNSGRFVSSQGSEHREQKTRQRDPKDVARSLNTNMWSKAQDKTWAYRWNSKYKTRLTGRGQGGETQTLYTKQISGKLHTGETHQGGASNP